MTSQATRANYLKHQVAATQCAARRSRHMSEIAKHWIDGEWTGSGTISESVNPATGAVLGQWADGGEAGPIAGQNGQ